MQQKELSLLSSVICVGKMPLEFIDDFCPPCEPIACIRHKGNDSIRRRPIAIVVVVDLDLPPHHQFHSLEHLPTHSVDGIEGVVASNEVLSARENIRSAHVETLKVERIKMRERRKRERSEVRRPPLMYLKHVVSFSIILLYSLRCTYLLFSFSCPSVSRAGCFPFSACRLTFFRMLVLYDTARVYDNIRRRYKRLL